MRLWLFPQAAQGKRRKKSFQFQEGHIISAQICGRGESDKNKNKSLFNSYIFFICFKKIAITIRFSKIFQDTVAAAENTIKYRFLEGSSWIQLKKLKGSLL